MAPLFPVSTPMIWLHKEVLNDDSLKTSCTYILILVNNDAACNIKTGCLSLPRREEQLTKNKTKNKKQIVLHFTESK